MKFICSQCNLEFAQLSEFRDHCLSHLENPDIKQKLFERIKSILAHFHPNVCPYCDRFLEFPSDSDITKFIGGDKDGKIVAT